MLKNTKKVFAVILAVAVVAMSMFTGVVVSAADPVTTAEGTIDLLEFGDYLLEAGSTSKYYDTNVADNGETGASWDDPIIIDSAEEFVYIAKTATNDTAGKYYKVADGIAGFNLSSSDLDLDGTLADNLDIITGSAKNHAGGTPGFQGHFDGNGITVYGAWTNHTEGNVSSYAGLFSCVKGEVTIKNVNVNKAYFVGKSAAGGIVGYCAEDTMCTVTIENCSVTDSYLETQGTGWSTGVGAILGFGASAPSFIDENDTDGDGDTTERIYINNIYNIKNCYVNLDADNVVSAATDGTEATEERVCHGGIAGGLGTNALAVSDCVVIGIKPYATSESTVYNDVQHSGLASHFTNVYTTSDVAIKDVALNGKLPAQDFTGRIFALDDAKLKGAAAVDNMNLDWSVWMADATGYPELANSHKNITLVDKEDGTHAATCACGFGGIAVDHTYVDGTCACGAELNCSTRKTIYWDGTVATGVANGTGTKDDPYIIKTAAELAYVVGQGQANYAVTDGKYFKVDDSIGAIVLQPKDKAEAIMALDSATATKTYFESGSDFLTWKYYGWEGSTFCGDLDFNGVTIYGLYIKDSTNNAALISNVDAGAAIHNVALKNSYLTSAAGNYQVGGIVGMTNSGSYAKKTAGAVWFDSCVVANNYMYNSSTSGDRTGVIIGGSGDVVYMDNCLVYGNDATYGDGVVAGIWSSALNNAKVSDSFVAPDGLTLVNDGNPENPLYYNMIRNSIIFGAKPYDLSATTGSRFNDPNCYVNVLTDADVAADTFTNEKVLGATDEQIKTVTVADLATATLGAAWIKTDTFPELRSFHDAVFGDGVSVGADGHAASCSCGLADSKVQEHTFVSDVEPAEWDSTYCSVCGYICEHVSMEEGYKEYEGDCVTGSGYEFNCTICGYHEGEMDDPNGHNFVDVSAEAGADCQTEGTIAYKYCSTCEKNYAADAADTEPFENALTDLSDGVLGDHKALTDAETGDVHYEKDDKNHWTVCSVCEEPIETSAHSGDAKPIGAEGHEIICDVCDYSSNNAAHNFVDGVCSDCSYECAHDYDGVCDTVCNLCEAYRDDAEDHDYDNECDTECNVCGETRWVWGHVYDDDTDADCNECGAIRAVAAEISVEVTGAYTLTPNEGYGAEFSAADITVTDKNGTEIKFNEKFGGYPIVKGQVYVVEFKPESAANVVDAVEWNCELVTEELFADAGTNNWYNDAVAYSAGVGIITGYGDTGLFGVADNIQRQDFVVILARYAGVDLSEYDDVEITFGDVPDGEYYTNAILWAADAGITTGYSSGPNAGKFGVGDVITREQLVTFLYRYATNVVNGGTAPKVSEEAAANAAAYADYTAVTGYAQDAVIWALDNGVINGQDGTYIDPAGNALRCEVAKMFFNIYLNDTLIPKTMANIDVFAPGAEPTTYVINYVRASENCYDDAYVYTWTPEFDGALTLTPVGEDAWVIVTNTADPFDSVVLQPYGPVAFNAKAGNTYEIQVMTWSESDGTAEFTATFTEGVAIMGSGTEFDPYVVTDVETLPAVDPMQTVYFVVSANPMATYTLTVNGSMMATFDVAANMGMLTGSAMGGQVVLENITPNMMGNIMFAITNTGLMPVECMYTLSEVTAGSTVGTYEDPDTLLVDGSIITASTSGAYYYTYTATEAGTLTISMLDNLCSGGWVCSIMGGAADAVYEQSAEAEHANPITYAVAAGEEIQIWVATTEFVPGDVYFTATFA